MVVGKDTLLVERKDSGDIKFTIDDSISEDFLHHFLFGRLSISTSDEVALVDFGLGLALSVLSAVLALGFGLIWGTLFVN
jgi:hypothetical protein